MVLSTGWWTPLCSCRGKFSSSSCKRTRHSSRVIEAGTNVQTVQKTVEIPQVQFLVKVVDMHVGVQRRVFMVQKGQKTQKFSQLQFINKVVNIPVVPHRQIPSSFTGSVH